MRPKSLPALLLLLILAAPAAAQSAADETLEIYFIDTEGGQATLFVTPSGESVLVDTGNPGGRDSERILQTLAAAGVERIDHLLITHFHRDHHGGATELAERVPIGHYIDHGPTVESDPRAAEFHARYATLTSEARHTVARPGDTLPIGGLEWRIVSAAGAVLERPLDGAGAANALCPVERPATQPEGENAQSTGSVITFGDFRVIDLGDLLIPQEMELVCPINRVGEVDLYITSHHGLATSGSAALVHALRPRVAVMNNGTRKGGAEEAFRVLHTSPELEDLWQLHWSHNAGLELNAPALFIANVDTPEVLAAVVAGEGTNPPAHDGAAHAIHVSARRDGSFTVRNGRNGFERTYHRE